MWLRSFLWRGSWVTNIFWLGPGLNVESQLPCPRAAAFISQDAFGWRWRMKCPKCPNVLNLIPSLCHTTAQCHKSHSIAHHKLACESFLYTSLFLSGEHHQPDPYNQHELLQGQSDPSAMGLSRADSSSCLSCTAWGELLRGILPFQQDLIYFSCCFI